MLQQAVQMIVILQTGSSDDCGAAANGSSVICAAATGRSKVCDAATDISDVLQQSVHRFVGLQQAMKTFCVTATGISGL